MAFTESSFPFSPSFGTVNTRDQCIRNAQKVYKKLLRYEPGETTLSFDVIGVLAFDDQGNFDEGKAKSLVHLFPPDRFDEISLLAFVQSCDHVYKSLLYLRAAFANSKLIDLGKFMLGKHCACHAS